MTIPNPTIFSSKLPSLSQTPSRDNGQENGNYSSIMELYRDNGKENGNYYSIMGVNIGIMDKKMETTIVLWGLILG